MADTVEQKAVILVKEETDNVPHPIFFGTSIQCKCLMFDILVPSEFRRNLIKHDSDWGYWFSYERMKEGKWQKVEMFLHSLPEEAKKDSSVIDWFTL